MPLLDLPIVLQRKSHTCALAAARCLLRFYGLSDPPSFASETDGADPRAVEVCLRRSGLGVLAGEADVDHLKYWCRRGWPPICLIQWADGKATVGHYVVVAGVFRNRVYYADPIDGMTSLPIAEWNSRWTDSERLGGTFRRWAIVGAPL